MSLRCAESKLYSLPSHGHSMKLADWFSRAVLADGQTTYLLDFLLGFTFFTALVYGVYGRRFGHQRVAAVLSATMGAALAIGLLSWQRLSGWSARDLGPVAIVLILVVTAGLVYGAIRLRPHQHRLTLSAIGDDLAKLQRDRRQYESFRRGLRRLQSGADLLTQHPRDAADIMLQLRRILPAEGALTERLARVRAQAERIRRGQAHEIEALRRTWAKLPRAARKQASRELAARFQALKLDVRLEHLAKRAKHNEQRITGLLLQAKQAVARHDHRRLIDLLESAERPQGQNVRLFEEMDDTEERLDHVARHVAKETSQVNTT